MKSEDVGSENVNISSGGIGGLGLANESNLAHLQSLSQLLQRSAVDYFPTKTKTKNENENEKGGKIEINEHVRTSQVEALTQLELWLKQRIPTPEEATRSG